MRLAFWSALALSVVVIVGLVSLMRIGGRKTIEHSSPAASAATAAAKDKSAPLVVYCAAGLRKAVNAAIEEYRGEFNTKVELQFGGSNTLLSSIELSHKGDLFIAADDVYLQQGREKQLVAEIVPLATQRAVLAVKAGNPAGIAGVESLTDLAVRVGLASEAAAVGKLSREILEEAGIWPQVEHKVLAFKPTVADVANDLKLGVIDAAIIWDATAAQYPEFDALEIESPVNTPQPISVGVLTSSTQPARALHLARYLAARDKGLPHFAKHHYSIVQGDPWADRPQLKFYSGGVLRPGVEKTLADFSAREGCDIDTIYNGCGILVGMMKTGDHPDAYFACDTSFMNSVGDLFGAVHEVCRTEIVIAVHKDNPLSIKGLDDLARPEIKLGMCNPEQSALGALSKKMLEAAGAWDKVSPQVRAQTPTADLVVTQLTTGALDAAIVFRSNLSRLKDKLAEVPIDAPGRVAIQPVAVAKDSQYPYLTGRLIEAILAGTSKDRFLESGFEWLGSTDTAAAKP